MQLATLYRPNTIPNLKVKIMWVGRGAYRQVKYDGCRNASERLMYNILSRIKRAKM